jgi:hypothetical protein
LPLSDLMSLPKDITTKAFRPGNGELAWRRQDIEEAITAIRDSGQAILGGEVWLVTNSHSWNGLIPTGSGKNSAVWHWETEARLAAESWHGYCQRTAEESVRAVRSMNVENETLPSLRDRLRFNLTYITEDGK